MTYVLIRQLRGPGAGPNQHGPNQHLTGIRQLAIVAIPLEITQSIRDTSKIESPERRRKKMPQDRVSGLLAAYFTQPYADYGEVALEIRDEGGLTQDEIRLITNQVLHIDAKTIIRHTGVSEK